MCVLVGSAIALHEQSPDATAAAADPHAGHVMPKAVPVAVTQAAPLPATGWTITADSNSAQAANVLDGDATTLWRTAATALPHLLTIDTQNRIALSGLTYLPPADSANGRIGRYEVLISDDGTTWSKPVATGTFADDATLKTVAIATVVTRFVRLRALSEAGNRTTKSAAAEINLLGGTDPALPRTGWTATADSQETAGEDGRAQNVLDGNTSTIWHTQYSDAEPDLPHTLTVDMKKTYLVSGLSYLPRPADSPNGHIGKYQVLTSPDGTTWGDPVASGAFQDSATVQSTTFTPQIARFVRLVALTEAGDRGPWSSAAEVNVLGRTDPSLTRTGWTAKADSEETGQEDDKAAYVLDGDPETLWHSAWSSNPPAALPHTLTIDMKKSQSVG